MNNEYRLLKEDLQGQIDYYKLAVKDDLENELYNNLAYDSRILCDLLSDLEQLDIDFNITESEKE